MNAAFCSCPQETKHSVKLLTVHIGLKDKKPEEFLDFYRLVKPDFHNVSECVFIGFASRSSHTIGRSARAVAP